MRQEGSCAGACSTAAAARCARAAASTTTAAAAARSCTAARGRADRTGGLRAQVARTAQRRETARRRVLRSRQVGYSRRRPCRAAEELGVPEEVDECRGHGRGALRFTRQLGVQPRARLAPRPGREGLSRQPRHTGCPRDHRQQGQGTAVLQRGERVLLVAESPGTFCDHGEITAGRAGTAGGHSKKSNRGALTPTPPPPPLPPPPPHPPPPPPH